MVQCQSSQSQQRVGVELLEASVSDLNKYKLRKTHEFGSFKYDPGKYYASSEDKRGGGGDSQINDKKPDEDTRVPRPTNNNRNSDGLVEEVRLDAATFEVELEAPWNQYAWAEELRLRVSSILGGGWDLSFMHEISRFHSLGGNANSSTVLPRAYKYTQQINGQVGFDSPMEKSTSWQRVLFGQAYKIAIHPVYHFWEWPLPSFAKSNADGVDGRRQSRTSRASNKPHAVIANGAALQRVPSSMRLLQKLCKKADVPLFVIHDPRVWGGNTHETLQEALKDMRRTIKNRVISRALEQQGSTAFTRGRILGQIETETKWQLKEQKRKSKEIFNSLGRSTSRQRKSDSDWSQLDSIRLERRLVERGAIKETTRSDGEGSSIVEKTYTEALIELARRCVQDVEEQQEMQEEEPTGAASSRGGGSSTASTESSSSPTPTTAIKV